MPKIFHLFSIILIILHFIHEIDRMVKQCLLMSLLPKDISII